MVGVVVLVALVDVGVDAGVELEELEVETNGFSGGLGKEGDGDC